MTVSAGSIGMAPCLKDLRTQKKYINGLPHHSMKGHLSRLEHSDNSYNHTNIPILHPFNISFQSICISLRSSFLPRSSSPPAATRGHRLPTEFGSRTTPSTTSEAVSRLPPPPPRAASMHACMRDKQDPNRAPRSELIASCVSCQPPFMKPAPP